MKILKRLYWLLPALSVLFLACAVITVNIYFPEKEVKKAYQNLEDELLSDTPPNGKGTDKPSKPQSFFDGQIFQKVADIISPSPAYAQSSDISELIKQMPEVREAYGRIKNKLPLMNELRTKGAVGEGNKGYLVTRGSLAPNESAEVESHNNDRKVVITGMAKAIVKINKLPETGSNINQVIPKAESMFAEIRKEKAQHGWWIQDANGSWRKK